MKNYLFVVTALLISMQLIAQSGEPLLSKKGTPILPAKGDYALGFNAIPVLDFALNTVNIMVNTGQTAAHPGYVGGFNNVLVGKYFLKDNLAIRGRVGINTNSVSQTFYGSDPLHPSSITPENILLSTTTNTNKSSFFSAGLEFRRGYNRLQGFYGGELMLGFNSTKTKNSYEIEYNQMAQDSGYIFFGSSRVLKDKSGMGVVFGARGFVGVEYFIFPKISLGAEFGWGFGVSYIPRGSVETEHWAIEPGSNATEPYQFEREVEGTSSFTSFGFGVDDGVSQALAPSAALTLLFHF